MRTTTRTWGTALMLTLAMAVTFGPLEGQTTTVVPAPATEDADVLALHGRQLARFERSFVEASLYLREAAERRGDDPTAVRELVEAAHYAWYGGRRLSALYTMYDAARMAVATGDEATAAEAYMDAAWVARETGRIDVAREILEEGMGLLGRSAVTVASRRPFVIQTW